MTVSEIVKDLLDNKMITPEAATVLLRAEAESIAFNVAFDSKKYNYNVDGLIWQRELGIYTTTTTDDYPLNDE